MKIHEIKLYQEFKAPVEVIWEAFNDHATFGKMMGQDITRVTDSTDPENVNGPGSVRSIKLPIARFEETIVKSEKHTCIEYRISSGLPVNYHYGHMQFKSLPCGKSAIDYSVKLGLKIPFIGGAVAAGLKRALGRGLKNYARRLEK
jgi:Polyketide cyclase / dehydrase and lipid transport